MKKIINVSLLLVMMEVLLAGCTSENKTYYFDKEGNMTTEKPAEVKVASVREIPADKVQVFLFHATQRCTTCKAIGRLAGETVNERFQDELKLEKIEFREINIDLPENKELARKFQAGGSALYINAITDNKDEIAEDTRAWGLTTNPDAFKDYLESKINALLGK